MAKKSNVRTQTLRTHPQSTKGVVAPRPWRPKAVLGSIILALVLGVGVVCAGGSSAISSHACKGLSINTIRLVPLALL